MFLICPGRESVPNFRSLTVFDWSEGRGQTKQQIDEPTDLQTYKRKKTLRLSHMDVSICDSKVDKHF